MWAERQLWFAYSTYLVYSSSFDEAFEYLVRAGCNIDFKDEKGRSPLSYAISKNNDRAVKRLLQVGAMMEGKDSRGFTIDSYLKMGRNKKIMALVAQARIAKHG